MKTIILFCSLLVASSSLLAQRYYPSGLQSRAKVSIGIGSSTYYGDLQEEMLIASTPNIMLSYEYQLSSRFSLRGDGAMYHIKASDANSISAFQKNRNLSFHSTNLELSSSLMFFLFRQASANYHNRNPFNVYALLGVGVSHFNPKTELNGQVYELRGFQTEGVSYGNYTAVIPGGIGMEIKAGGKFSVAFEATYRHTFTDYLDDVSHSYPGPENFQFETAAKLSDRRLVKENGTPQENALRGNPAVNDSYAFYNIRLIYFLDKVYYQAKDKKKKSKR